MNKKIHNKIFEILLSKPNNKILDVGSGRGDFLNYLIKNKLIDKKNLYGIDIIKPKENCGFNFKTVNLNSGLNNFPYEGFDVIYSNQVIEHILSPYDFINNLSKITKHNGYLILTTPNIRSIRNLFNILIKGNSARTSGVHSLKCWDGEHLHYFSSKALVHLLHGLGFKVEVKSALVDQINKSLVRKILSFFGSNFFVREFISSNLLIIGKKEKK